MPYSLLFTLALRVASYFLDRAKIKGEIDADRYKRTATNLNASLELFDKTKTAGQAAADRFDDLHGELPDDPNRRD